MKITNLGTPTELAPGKNNPRNSEGSFLTLPDGKIVFAYSRYTGDSSEDDAECEVACIYSYDGGESFDTENIQTLASGSEYGVKNVMSVTLRYMDNGDIGLFYIVKYEVGGQRTQYKLRRYKNDLGGHYAEILVAPDKTTGDFIVNNDRVVRLTSGRWIVLAALHPTSQQEGEGDPKWFDHQGIAYAFVSDDDGFTWRSTDMRLALNNPYSTSGLQEPGCVELPGSAVYGYFRTDLKCQYESVSLDGGEHWFAPQATRFYSPCSPMLIKRNPYSGIYYAIWNPVPNFFGRKMYNGVWGRTPLVIASSADGVNYSEPEIIEDDEARGFCYPAMHFIDEHTMLLGYCSGGEGDGRCCLNRLTVRKITVKD